MPAVPRIGMDQDIYDWSALPYRPRLAWPDGNRVALCVVIALDCAEVDPPDDPLLKRMPQPPVGTPYPYLDDFLSMQYGLRIGLFRILKVLDKYALPATVALDATVATKYTFVVEQCKMRGYEFIGRGLVANYPLGNSLSPDDAREYVQRSLDAVERSTAARPRGWFGLDYLESRETPQILADLGVEFVLDWPNDEQPYPLTVSNGSLISLPTLLELDDAYTQEHRKLSVWRWEQAVKEAFDTLSQEGAETGRLLVLSLHPWLIGQAFRVKCLDNALAHIVAHEGVWKARAGEVASWYRQALSALAN